MEITKMEKTGKRYRVYLNDEPCFCIPFFKLKSLPDGILLREGAELDEAQYAVICREILIPGARKRCLDLLTVRDRTEKELRTRLRRDEYPEEVIDDAIAYAASYHYLDDRRYAVHYVEMNSGRLGSRALRMELLKKGIDGTLADEVLEDIGREDSREAIARWLEKRHFNPETADEKERSKQMRFLCGKGFDLADIRHVMDDD